MASTAKVTRSLLSSICPRVLWAALDRSAPSNLYWRLRWQWNVTDAAAVRSPDCDESARIRGAMDARGSRLNAPLLGGRKHQLRAPREEQPPREGDRQQTCHCGYGHQLVEDNDLVANGLLARGPADDLSSHHPRKRNQTPGE